MSRRPRLPIPRRRIVLPGPSRLFLYAETALLLILGISLLSSYLKQYPPSSQTGGSFYQIADIPQGTNHGETSHNQEEAGPPDSARQSESESQPQESKKFIKWVDFTVTSEAMTKAFRLDVDTIQQEPHLNWIQLLAYLGARYGGDFSRYKAADMDALVQKLKSGQTMEELTEEMKYYNYYLEAYSAVLGGMVGTFEDEIPMDQVPDSVSCRPAEPAEGSSQPQTVWVTRYGLKAFSPIAKGFPYSEFDDFGTARSYGFKRQHLGHDMMGQVGSPIIAVESGIVEALGWNQYGGWRIGIRSFDKKRYYYYAHLRKNYPYQSNLTEGCTVQAGDVIGYMGRTGYSLTENTNNIDEPHLHFGLQLIFDESQKEGNNEIWISCYELVKFLHQNQSLTEKTPDTKEWHRVYRTKDF
ncbi:MAG: M23 family metallopeptidase [Lachnospiraceae bacterium]|nr:M23 family metallopeptidase [Lachnospiraceae bacterium]